MSTKITIRYTSGEVTVVKARPRLQIMAEDRLMKEGAPGVTRAPMRYALTVAYCDYRMGGGTLPWDAWIDSLDDYDIEETGPKATPDMTGGIETRQG